MISDDRSGLEASLSRGAVAGALIARRPQLTRLASQHEETR